MRYFSIIMIALAVMTGCNVNSKCTDGSHVTEFADPSAFHYAIDFPVGRAVHFDNQYMWQFKPFEFASLQVQLIEAANPSAVPNLAELSILSVELRTSDGRLIWRAADDIRRWRVVQPSELTESKYVSPLEFVEVDKGAVYVMVVRVQDGAQIPSSLAFRLAKAKNPYSVRNLHGF